MVPDSVGKVVKGGAEVLVERGAGLDAGFPDAEYSKAGASVVDDARTLYGRADVVVKVRRPSVDDAAMLADGATLISLLGVGAELDGVLPALTARHVTMLALERVPRITRAQSMDVLSSQSTVAGSRAGVSSRTY